MRISSIHCAPLLQGKVQLDLVTNSQEELLIEELLLRGIAAHLKTKIAQLKQLLAENEHSNESDTNAKKFFSSWLLAASD